MRFSASGDTLSKGVRVDTNVWDETPVLTASLPPFLQNRGRAVKGPAGPAPSPPASVGDALIGPRRLRAPPPSCAAAAPALPGRVSMGREVHSVMNSFIVAGIFTTA